MSTPDRPNYRNRPKRGRLNKPRQGITPWWEDKQSPNYGFVEAREEKLRRIGRR